MRWGVMNGEVKGIWKEAFLVWFKVALMKSTNEIKIDGVPSVIHTFTFRIYV
jgi:hypothetical protein